MTVRIDGFEELQAKLEGVEKTIATSNTTVEAVMREGQESAAQYPPTTEANSPGNPSGRWYERGFGPRWSTGGKRTSEQLNSKWFVRADKRGVEVGNTASYSGLVHGPDALPIHKSRGWKNLQDELAKRMPKLEQKITEAVQRAMGVK